MHRDRIAARFAALAVIVTLAPASAIAQTPARTPWGDPDLQGTWDFTTITPLQRPAELAGKEFLTESEAAALEKQIRRAIRAAAGRATRSLSRRGT